MTKAEDVADVRRITPAVVEHVLRMVAADVPASGSLGELTACVYRLVIAAVRTAPDDPDRWQARLEAAIVAARDIGRDVRESLRAAATRERTP